MNSIPSRRNTSAITSLPHSSLTVSSRVGRSILCTSSKFMVQPAHAFGAQEAEAVSHASLSGRTHDVSMLVQPKGCLPRGFENLWMPRDAAGVGPAEHREQHSGLAAGVAKTAHDARRHRYDVQRF